MNKKSFLLLTFFPALLLCAACSSNNKKLEVQKYRPAAHQLPLEPRYSRVTWSHLPKPIVPESNTKGPYMRKVMSYEVPNSNVKESVTILSNSVGYEAIIPRELEKRKVSLIMEGTTIEILTAICTQADMTAEIDDMRRTIRVFDRVPEPRLY